MSKTLLQKKKDASRSALQLINALETALQLIYIPVGYTLIKVDYLEQQDATPVWLFRYEKAYTSSNNGLDGEHCSFVVDALNHQLKSITYMIAERSNGELPDSDNAYRVAMSFLDKVAPDLKQTLKILSIKQHDEIIIITTSQGEEIVTISGIKVKFLQKDSKAYTWVIVGSNGRVITFERDITWDKVINHRVTEKWLHSGVAWERTSDRRFHPKAKFTLGLTPL